MHAISKLTELFPFRKAITFEEIAREWHLHKEHTWAPDHFLCIWKRLERDILCKFGHKPIHKIKALEVLNAIREVEARGNIHIAHRLLQYCSQVFRYGVATGRIERDVTTDLKGALKPITSKHLAYLPEEELPGFLEKLSKYPRTYSVDTSKYAFQFLILTFVRSNELRGAKWEEFNFEKMEWRVPAWRMKMKEQHIVPLNHQMVVLLEKVRKISGDNPYGLLFPSYTKRGKKEGRYICENVFRKMIINMGYQGKLTAHGFRSTASTILNENGFAADVIERQLAHTERNLVRAAYNHAQYLKERREMMEWWGDYLEEMMGL